MTRLFLKAFSLVFIAEMGDKTQLATLGLAATAPKGISHPAVAIFAGSALALATTSAIAALCGSWLQSRVPPRVVKAAAGVMFLAFGAIYLREAMLSGTGRGA